MSNENFPTQEGSNETNTLRMVADVAEFFDSQELDLWADTLRTTISLPDTEDALMAVYLEANRLLEKPSVKRHEQLPSLIDGFMSRIQFEVGDNIKALETQQPLYDALADLRDDLALKQEARWLARLRQVSTDLSHTPEVRLERLGNVIDAAILDEGLSNQLLLASSNRISNIVNPDFSARVVSFIFFVASSGRPSNTDVPHDGEIISITTEEMEHFDGE